MDLDGVYDIRARLEPLAAERAAQLRSPAELAQMRRRIEAMRERIDDADAFNQADADFHALVAQASRSPVLSSTLDRLSELALLSRAVLAPQEEIRERSFDDVERVYAAIERQHPKRAANAMERHVLNVRADYEITMDREPSGIAGATNDTT